MLKDVEWVEFDAPLEASLWELKSKRNRLGPGLRCISALK